MSHNLDSILPGIVDAKIEELMPPASGNSVELSEKLDKCMEIMKQQESLIKDLQFQVNKNDDRLENVERGDRLGTLIIEGLKIDNSKSLEAKPLWHLLSTVESKSPVMMSCIVTGLAKMTLPVEN